MSDAARIVLVKPGDILIFGNVTADVDQAAFTETMKSLKEQLGLAHILVFEDDIDLAVQQPIERSDGCHTVLQNDLCTKCGKVRGIRFDDGTVDWIARWQVPWDCEHELPAEAS